MNNLSANQQSIQHPTTKTNQPIQQTNQPTNKLTIIPTNHANQLYPPNQLTKPPNNLPLTKLPQPTN